MFSEYCENKFTCEPVEIHTPDSQVHIFPNLEARECRCDVNYVNSLLGLQLDVETITRLLSRMGLTATAQNDNKQLLVSVPPTRSDILDACDIMEDVGIAYGYNNLPVSPPTTVCFAQQNNLNRLTDKLRLELAQGGYTEILTLSLCSQEENFSHLNHPDDGSAVVIANPKTFEFQVGRTNLLVGLLKTLSHNRNLPLPLKLFEVSDIMHIDPKSDVGASNERRLCAAFYGKRSGFEDIHGLVDRLMAVLIANPLHVPGPRKPGSLNYFIRPSDNPTYLSGRSADIFLSNGSEVKLGSFGILHPKVLNNFALNNVCSAVEINIEPFL